MEIVLFILVFSEVIFETPDTLSGYLDLRVQLGKPFKIMKYDCYFLINI
jgi:hypothetical protein